MAERARMTAAELADKLLADEHADVLRESVAWMARELMEADVSAQIGAELGERSLERTTLWEPVIRHLMRPAHTHGSAHRVDHVARLPFCRTRGGSAGPSGGACPMARCGR
jgi:transposase-like protein